MLGTLLGNIIPGLVNMGEKMVIDRDKQAEYAFRLQEMTFSMMEKIALQATVPWVDATVKLAFALLVFARPVGSFLLTLKGIQLHVDGIQIPEVVHYGLDSMFPAWFGARQIDKYRKGREQVE